MLQQIKGSNVSAASHVLRNNLILILPAEIVAAPVIRSIKQTKLRSNVKQKSPARGIVDLSGGA